MNVDGITAANNIGDKYLNPTEFIFFNIIPEEWIPAFAGMTKRAKRTMGKSM